MRISSLWAWPSTPRRLFKLSVLGATSAGVLMTTGCASNPSIVRSSSLPNDFDDQQGNYQSAYLDADSLDALQDLLSATDMRAVEGDRLLILKHGDVWKRMTVGFKMDLNNNDPRIAAQRSWFISRQPYLDRLSARASRYLFHTVKEAERRGMPTELALLPVIESSYDPAATSSAAAAGLWQFIPSTGRIYGLKQTELYDGRRDVVESTRAAYEFLGSLYNQFGSWELALAAYNAGPGTVQKAINRNIAAGLPTDYWSLRLPQETMNYVPRFLAVAQIIKNPQDFGVRLPPIANRPHFREVMVPGGLELDQISAITGLPRAELYALNPAHRGERLAPEVQTRLLIPADLNPTIDARLKTLKPSDDLLMASASPSIASPSNSANKNSTPTKSANSSTIAPSSTIKAAAVSPVGSASSSASRIQTQPTANATKRQPTPRGSDALAAFAASADVPSAPRIPVAITPAANIKPVNVQPQISASERQQIAAQIKLEGNQQSVQQALQPQASQAEKDQVVAEIQAIAPTGTEIVDPVDGKIKLTALQTSLSVSEKKGQDVSKSFAYPKALAEAETKSNSDAVQRNQGKNVIKTATDVVVVPPKGKRSTYTIVPGDTLVSIAMKNGLNWRDIAKWNQIDPEKSLFVGTSLYLYDAKPSASALKSKRPEHYVVKTGDNLTNIAEQFDVTLEDLAAWNDLSRNSMVMVGQKLRLTPDRSSQSSRTARYRVQRGETLQQLSQRYDLTTAELAALTEGLSANSRLQAGQSINVPVIENKPNNEQRTQRTEQYIVKRGETLSSIAEKFRMEQRELRELNRLRSSSIDVGQTLKIPAARFIPDDYVVKSGDSLIGISQRFNLDVADLARKNNLKSNSQLQVGQRLNLSASAVNTANPRDDDSLNENRDRKNKANRSSARNTETYTVKSGESWNSIANRFEMSAKALAEMNDTSTRDSLQRGQRIVVPKLVVEYTVKRGDTLIALANRYGIEPDELAQMNGMKADGMLRVGDSIKVPN